MLSLLLFKGVVWSETIMVISLHLSLGVVNGIVVVLLYGHNNVRPKFLGLQLGVVGVQDPYLVSNLKPLLEEKFLLSSLFLIFDCGLLLHLLKGGSSCWDGAWFDQVSLDLLTCLYHRLGSIY